MNESKVKNVLLFDLKVHQPTSVQEEPMVHMLTPPTNQNSFSVAMGSHQNVNHVIILKSSRPNVIDAYLLVLVSVYVIISHLFLTF